MTSMTMAQGFHVGGHTSVDLEGAQGSQGGWNEAPSSPIQVVDATEVAFEYERMAVGRVYPLSLAGEQIFARRLQDGSIELLAAPELAGK